MNCLSYISYISYKGYLGYLVTNVRGTQCNDATM
jgi:hypothetical protein